MPTRPSPKYLFIQKKRKKKGKRNELARRKELYNTKQTNKQKNIYIYINTVSILKKQTQQKKI